MTDRTCDPISWIALRNARIRAWQAYGMPVRGRWAQNDDLFWFSLHCTVCSVTYDMPAANPCLPVEQVALLDCCTHISPFFLEIPEIEDLTKLELLAG